MAEPTPLSIKESGATPGTVLPPPSSIAPSTEATPAQAPLSDVVMSDAPAASSPAPPACSNGNAAVPKAAPEVQKPPHLRMPEPADYDSKSGALTVREYLNAKVTPHLLAATKMVTCEPWNLPDNPLQILGEYLLEKSKELEQGKRPNGSGDGK